jgi:tight adherence protein B
MSALLAAAAAGLAVFALFEALAAVDGLRLLGAMTRVVAPARAAGRDGHAPGRLERRRLALTSALVLCTCGWLLAGQAAALVCAVAGPPVALALVAARRRRWRAAVAAEAPAAARALADALRGGHALPSAVGFAARDGALGGPARELLGQAVLGIDLGARTQDALLGVARRAGPGPWPALVAAILVQREAGGDLARLLHELADDLDTVARVEADARAASSQARLTARIVVALPVAGALLIELAAPGSLAAILGDPLAVLLVAGALALEALALVSVRRIARVGAE